MRPSLARCIVIAVMAAGCGSKTGLGSPELADEDARRLAPRPGVVAGCQHSCAWSVDGTIWCWGYNADGELGDGTTIERHTPVRITRIPGLRGLALEGCRPGATGFIRVWSVDGSIWSWTTDGPEVFFQDPAIRGIAEYRSQLVWLEDGRVALLYRLPGSGESREIVWAPELASDVVQLSGNPMSPLEPLVVLVDGSVWRIHVRDVYEVPLVATAERVTWFDEVAGLAPGDTTDCAWHLDGTASCRGDNSLGQVGDGTRVDRRDPVRVAGLEGVAGMTMGSQHTCAWLRDGSAWCWGSNGYGRLGDGTQVDRLEPVRVLGLEGVVSMSTSRSHTCAVLRDASVWCWGWNRYGQVGDGSTEDRFAPVQILEL